MCGLVGVIGNIGEADKRIFRDMLLFDTLRGFDSTGITFVNLKGVHQIEKDLGSPSNLWEYGKGTELSFKGVPKGAYIALMGHNRSATIGSVTIESAHPFTYGDIVGSHNGTLRDYTDLAGADKLEVDSQAIFNDINTNGVEHTWENFTGAAALTYWDSKEKTVNIVRNNERPLFFAEDITRSVMYYASEAWMISVAAHRNDVKLHSVTSVGTTPKDTKSVALDTLFKIKPHVSGFDLVSSVKLKKKYEYPTTYGRNGLYTGGSFFKKPKNRGHNVLNFGWAAGLEKADKSHRDVSVCLSYRVDSGDDVYFASFDSLGNLYRIYPSSELMRDTLESRLSNHNEHYYTIKVRPRVIDLGSEYGVGSEGVRYAHSIVRKDRKRVVKVEKDLKKA